MTRLSFLCGALVLAIGCEGPDTGAAPSGGAGGGGEAGGDAGTVCARPEEGCPCEPGSEPVSCYGDPVLEGGGRMTCSEGLRYCRDGRWTGCELIREFEMSAHAALRDGPSACNPCNPDCSIARDYPTGADLPGSSTDVVYDPSAGGIVIDGGGVTTGMLPDGDGDMVPDVADECPGTGWRAPCDGDASDDGFYHTLPYGGPAEIDPFDIRTQVRTADVYFLMDTTGSMDGEIANLRSSLTSGTFIPGCSGGIIGATRCTIPDAWFGVGRFEDYPISPYGSSSYGDRPFVHMRDITSSISATQTSVNALTTRNGNDWPESHSQALYSLATGAGLGSYTPARSGCPAGAWGYPCFRDGTIPIVVMFTDADFHNGPNGYRYSGFGDTYSGGTGTLVPSPWSDTQCRSSVCSYDSWCCTYGWDSTCMSEASTDCNCWTTRCGGSGTCPAIGSAGYPVLWCHAVEALNARGVKVITINSGTARPDAVALGNATGSVDGGGSPFVFDISSSGTGLGAAVVDAIVDLANYSRMDVMARAVDNTATAIDERGFVDSITPVSWGPGSCTGISGSSFIQCLPGTNLNFRVSFRNDFVMPTSVPQVFEFWIETVGDGSYVLDRIPVRIVVPPEVPTYPPSGSYWRDYDATTRCEIPPQRPDWGQFSWTASTPPDSRIRFEFRTADTLAGLGAATPATVTVPPSTSPIDVGSLLVSSGLTNYKPYLRVTAVLVSSTDRTVTPVLTGFELQFTCTSSE